MQDKHFIIIHKDEDRDIFINKLNYPKTVFHVGDNPQPGDIIVDKSSGNQSLLLKWIIENFYNLPEFVIFSQAYPDDHVHEPLLAIESTLTAGYGSFCYARPIYNQFSSSWVRINPIREFAHKLGLGFINDNNISKYLYCFGPGEIFYVSKEHILKRPISFYENLIFWNTDEKYFELVNKAVKPSYLFREIDLYHPELKNLSRQEQLNKLTEKWPLKHNGYSGWSYEALWSIIWADKELFNLLNKSQACLGNKLYFNSNEKTYDPNFNFWLFPYSPNLNQTVSNLKLLENDWFDWNCPHYLKWREKLIEKTIYEGNQRGFNGLELIDYYEKIGYKHISL